tara:strand:+ start:558 stop:719 length:162 start_codon:yes stop_codon:yes gene_type:complete
MTGRSEHEAELKFNTHECEGFRDLADLPSPILKRLAMKEITEDEAWKLAEVAA